MIGQKGQEAAPFELLVAVIIMGFVIFIGLQAMEQLNRERCYNETNAKLEELKTKLETVVSERSPQQINFTLSACFNPEQETIKIKDFQEPILCAQHCGAAKNLCTFLDYYYSGGGGFSIRKCVNISPDAEFQRSGGKCLPKEGRELVDFRSEIPQGNYQLVNKTSVTGTFPVICAYRRED